jgi:ribosomal protein S18 acetylase RimI-like enzyme
MSEFDVRPARDEDLPAVIGLWRELQDINAAYDPRLTLNPDAGEWFLGYLGGQLDNPHMAVLVAEHEGAVVGYTFGQVMQRPTLLSGDCGYIADVCVAAGWRGRGIGRRLHERMRAWFLSRGVTSIEVQIVRANPASQAFWRKMGYGDFLRTLRADFGGGQ